MVRTNCITRLRDCATSSLFFWILMNMEHLETCRLRPFGDLQKFNHVFLPPNRFEYSSEHSEGTIDEKGDFMISQDCVLIPKQRCSKTLMWGEVGSNTYVSQVRRPAELHTFTRGVEVAIVDKILILPPFNGKSQAIWQRTSQRKHITQWTGGGGQGEWHGTSNFFSGCICAVLNRWPAKVRTLIAIRFHTCSQVSLGGNSRMPSCVWFSAAL